MRLHPIPLITSFLLSFFSGIAQPVTEPAVELRSGRFIPSKNIGFSSLETFQRGLPIVEGRQMAVIQFYQLPNTAQRQELKSRGIELLEYVPKNAYTVSITASLDAGYLLNQRVRAIFELSPEQKMHPSLARNQAPAWARRQAGMLDCWLSFPKTFSFASISRLLKMEAVEIIHTDYQQYQVIGIRFSATRLREIAALPFVEYLEPAPHGDQLLNREARGNSRGNMLSAPYGAGGFNLEGNGVTVGIGDDADPQYHADFNHGLINFGPAGHNYHGTHVHGIVGGPGLLNPVYRGYATQARLITQYLSGIISNASTYVADYGMVITNNSYGDVVNDCSYTGTYDLLSRIMDLQAFALPELSNVFAAGNDGGNTCAPYPAGFATVLGAYQSAKNPIMAGATEKSGVITFFSSRGPVNDGRLKPEIVADGSAVISSAPSNIYNVQSGTSMSAPGVAGGLALLTERYRQLNGGANPSSALMKALICNGGTDMGNPGPDFTYGYGGLNLWRSIQMVNNNRYLSSTIALAGQNNHLITVPANTAQVKVMLYWHDPAAAVFASSTLINDLDLELETPSTATVLPWKLDTLPANVNLPATNTTADRINNIEQVTINNPAAGTYTARVKGTSIPSGNQNYVLVYDFLPIETRLSFPIGSETLIPGETVRICWESYGDPANDFTLEYSTNNGSSWTTIDNSIASNLRQYIWTVPSVSTTQAMVRITRNSTAYTFTSGSFVILSTPTVVMNAVQCETYIAANWTATAPPAATDYEVFLSRKGVMVSQGFTTATSITIGGLSPDTTYWLAVAPRISGVSGRRSVATSRQPNSGTCAGSISDNDLRMDSITAPVYGRMNTSTQLTSATTITARFKNLDDVAVNNFTMRYSINGAPFVSEAVAATVNPGALYTHNFATPADFSATGEYALLVEVINNSGVDNVTVNNSRVDTVRQLANTALVLPFTDNLESLPAFQLYHNRFGLPGSSRYDYTKTFRQGRLSTLLSSGMAYSGNRSFLLDLDGWNGGTGNTNYIYGTYNLTGVDANTRDIRLDFQLKNHGDSVVNANNSVWVRGDDTQPWLLAYRLSATNNEPGVFKKTKSIEISDILLAGGQNYTTSFQVRWGQFGLQRIRDNENGPAYSFDDIRIYEAIDDLGMISIDTPIVNSCGLGANVPVRITFRNASPNNLNNIPVRLVVDGITIATETVVINPSGLAPNAQHTYTFTATANLSALGNHTVFVDIQYPTDDYDENDTMSVSIVNSPRITSFPYLQNFESGNGNWYAGGRNSSWQYGSPASLKVDGAASGTRAWKTSLTGGYNNSELSYLYSPCFDVSGMTNPTLSMNLALDLEDCGPGYCDGAWVEYSTDGKTWTKLGSMGSGTNWYNKNYGGSHLWSVQDYTRWHVATIPLPAGQANLRIRIVVETDPFVTWEGVAVDDIHIYDNNFGIYDGVTMGSPVNQTINGGSSWIDFLSGGKLVASIQPNGQNLGSTDVQAYINTGGVRNDGKQYYHDRNITIKPANITLADSAIVRFYFLDSETEALLNATGCGGCTRPEQVTELGVTKYSDPDDNAENGTIADNINGQYYFHSADWNYKIPFDKGYYVEFRVRDFSEFWLNNGGFDRLTALPVDLLSFTAKKDGREDVKLEWQVANERDLLHYELQMARGNQAYQDGRFQSLTILPPQAGSASHKTYQYFDTEPQKTGVRYYRLKMVDRDGRVNYSAVRALMFTNDLPWLVYPNPSSAVFHFVFQLNTGEQADLKIYDAVGRVVSSRKLTGTGFQHKENLDLRGLQSGIYLLQVSSPGRNESFQLVKQ